MLDGLLTGSGVLSEQCLVSWTGSRVLSQQFHVSWFGSDVLHSVLTCYPEVFHDLPVGFAERFQEFLVSLLDFDVLYPALSLYLVGSYGPVPT